MQSTTSRIFVVKLRVKKHWVIRDTGVQLMNINIRRILAGYFERKDVLLKHDIAWVLKAQFSVNGKLKNVFLRNFTVGKLSYHGSTQYTLAYLRQIEKFLHEINHSYIQIFITKSMKNVLFQSYVHLVNEFSVILEFKLLVLSHLFSFIPTSL